MPAVTAIMVERRQAVGKQPVSVLVNQLFPSYFPIGDQPALVKSDALPGHTDVRKTFLVLFARPFREKEALLMS